MKACRVEHSDELVKCPASAASSVALRNGLRYSNSRRSAFWVLRVDTGRFWRRLSALGREGSLNPFRTKAATPLVMLPTANQRHALRYGTGGTLESPPDRPTIAGSTSSRDVDEIRKSPNPGAPGDATLSNCMSST